MKIECLAVTHEDSVINDDELYIFGGKVAGICYMKEDYFETKFSNNTTAKKRAGFVANSGHHSVFEHGFITLKLSGIPKILAMLLNSTEYYTTSEKSARYTFMKPETEIENSMYTKWTEKFGELIFMKYPNIDNKLVEKLAIENARYMLSVYTPTTMAWTVSFRQLAYIIRWVDLLVDNTEDEKLKQASLEFSKLIKDITDCDKLIIENKNREFEFFRNKSEINNVEFFGDVYQTTYFGTYAQLAQAQRHRTLHYEIERGDYGYYVPEIIKVFDLTDEWLSDIGQLEDLVPQGKLVKILEQGRAIKFFDKAKERLCGRAQLEIALQTKDTLQKFIDNKENLSNSSLNSLNNIIGKNEVVTKCSMNGFKCQEICRWGAKFGLDRLI